jgi:hypothetical protein
VDAVFYPNTFDVDITRFLVYYRSRIGSGHLSNDYLRNMSEDFTVNFLYKGVVREIHCTLRVSTYTYQFLCAIDNTEMILERDDEGNLRAMEADPFSVKKKKPDPALVRTLIEEMERILRP